MQSATSFFNRALFRKNLQRFWPLWLGYVLIWLLLLPLPLLNELADYHGVPDRGRRLVLPAADRRLRRACDGRRVRHLLRHGDVRLPYQPPRHAGLPFHACAA